MRASGILLPIFSLPGEYGIGSFSREAYEFVDWLCECKQKYWQILPLGPVGFGSSPYQAFSTFAGNPLFISVDSLFEQGLITEEERDSQRMPESDAYIDYERLTEIRMPLLKKAALRFEKNEEFYTYCEEQSEWLRDYTLFRAIRDRRECAAWNTWEDELKFRDPEALKKAEKEYEEEILVYTFLEYEFSRQWRALKGYANERGVKIIGDLPIYVSMDSSDVWSDPEMFMCDENMQPTLVAGCPPDYFAPEGQLWGNPVYNWEMHAKRGYAWWIKRLRHCFEIFDLLRLDHFRGFASYYTIKYGSENAINGEWKKGPGMDFFNAIKKEMGDVPIIAEDLGLLSEDVHELLRDSGYPGMKILGFAFDDTHNSTYLPHRYDKNCVVYTGTHDNDTFKGWLEKISPELRQFVCDYIGRYGCSNEELVFEIIRLAMRSTADYCIIPIQDYLALGSEARINTPSTVGNNWKWRMRRGSCTSELSGKIAFLTGLYSR